MDPTKTKLVSELKHDSPLISCRFDPTGKYVFFGAQDSRVWRWRRDGQEKQELAGHDSWCRALAFDRARQVLVTGGYDGRLIWWPTEAEKVEAIRRLDAHAGWVRAVAVSPDGQLLASVGNDRLVRLWKLEDGTPVAEFPGHESHIYNVAFHPAGNDLLTGDLKGNLFQWEISSGKILRKFQAASLHKYDETFKADIGGTRGLQFSPDGHQFAASGITNVTNAFAGVGEPMIEVFDWESGKSTIQHTTKAKLRGVAWGFAFYSDQLIIGVCGGHGGGFLCYWKPDQKEELAQFKLPNTGRDMDLSGDRELVAVAHFDSRVRIYGWG